MAVFGIVRNKRKRLLTDFNLEAFFLFLFSKRRFLVFFPSHTLPLLSVRFPHSALFSISCFLAFAFSLFSLLVPFFVLSFSLLAFFFFFFFFCCVSYLSDLSDSKDEEMKRILMTNWLSLDPNFRARVKTLVIQTFASESDARHQAAQVFSFACDSGFSPFS